MTDKRKDPTPSVKYRSGLWRGRTKKGEPCLKGSTQDYWITVLRARNDGGERDPHSVILFSPKREAEQRGTYYINLWSATARESGRTYLRALHSNLRYHIYAEARKKNDKSPDYTLVVYDLEAEPKVVYDRALRNEQAGPDMGYSLDDDGDSGYIQEPDDSDPWGDDDDIPF